MEGESTFMNNTTNGILEYYLPSELYARVPVKDKSSDRMMVGYRDGRIVDSIVSNIGYFLDKGDTIIFNNSKTINGLLMGYNSEFGYVRIHIISIHKDILKCSIEIRQDLFDDVINQLFEVSSNLNLRVMLKNSDNTFDVKSNLNHDDLLKELEIVGNPISSNYVTGDIDIKDYQNELSSELGSLENPVASSHFTKKLIENLKNNFEINVGYVTLHCISNPAYIDVDDVKDYKVPSEWFSVGKDTMELIKETKKNNKKVIAIGTTVARTLESLDYTEDYSCTSKLSGYTTLGIFPGYKFKVVDGIVTNFHGSRSSRLSLAAAFIGEKNILSLYQFAIEKKYKFFEFGDCTLLFNGSYEERKND